MSLFLVNGLIIIVSLLFSVFLTFNQESTDPILTKPKLIENKGIYLTAYTAGDKKRRGELIDLIDQTELNSVVIDLKDYSGRIFFDTDISLANQIKSEDVRIPDLADWLKELKKKGIYTIARIVVFQDPYLAQKMPQIALRAKNGEIWRDYKGLSWVDPTQKFIWDYNLDLAKEAVKIGFDEINFDYIRFPSDGDIKQIVYANLDNSEDKSRAMREFYRYTALTLSFYPVITSADLFGMTLWRFDGLNIGQRYEDAAPYFDYISPMVYPSHYPAGFEGFNNPAQYPYEIIYRSLMRVKDKIPHNQAKIRPWLQDFDLGADYTPEMIKLEKKATNDANGFGWLLWNASNRYTIAGLEQSN